MVVVKFGGTSVGAVPQIVRAAEIILSMRESKPVVILSAMGGVTDALLQAGEAALSGQVRSRDDKLWASIKQVRGHHGAILGPFEAWLLLRGLRTLDIRVRAQAESAALLATRFANHPSVSAVLYPGLPSHPGHAIAVNQMSGYGGMLSIRVRAGERAAIDAAARVEVWKRATSLGGVESLIEHRASVEGPTSPCPTDLLRLSVGLEDVDDLYNDLDRALRAANA